MQQYYNIVADDSIRFMDFSLSPEPVVFKIEPDEFRGWPEIPLDVLAELADAGGQRGTPRQQMEQMLELFEGVLEPESFATFKRRTQRSTPEDPNRNPISMRHITKILPWLMEVYGLRPTQPSDESPSGSDETDTSLTDGASHTE